MTALTTAQKEYLRDMSGDDRTDSDGAYEVSDASLQVIYDDADQGASDLDRTVVYVLRRRRAKAARLTDSTGEYQRDMQRQKFLNLGELLEEAERRAGMTAGTLTTGLYDHHLDMNRADVVADATETNEWPL